MMCTRKLVGLGLLSMVSFLHQVNGFILPRLSFVQQPPVLLKSASDGNQDNDLKDSSVESGLTVAAKKLEALPRKTHYPSITGARLYDALGVATDYSIFVMATLVCATLVLSMYGYAYQFSNDGIGIDTIAHLRERQDFQNEIYRMTRVH
jgi:hypothetical protein